MREFARNFPDHYRAADVRESLGEMEENLAKLQRELGVEGEAGYELGYLHDLLRADLELGDFSTARQTGRQIMAKHPDFAPVYNNLSQIEFMEGNHEQALAYTRRVLTLEPDNFQASANLTRYLFLLGHVEEAHAQAEHLASLPTRGLEFWVKQAEAFTHLGEHAR
ncbi:MAG: hypothetical protein R2911_43020 [Caldilineaceae bacterium]